MKKLNELQSYLTRLRGLMLTLIILCSIGSGNVWGDEVSITFADEGLSNDTQYSDPFELDDNVTITFAGGANDGKYYTTGSGIRTYGGGTVTIATTSGTISQAVFTWSGNSYKPSSNVADVGTYTNASATWTGNETSFTLTRPSGSGHWRLQSVTVTYTPAGSGGCDKLNREWTSRPSTTTYGDWSGKAGSSSSAIYAGNSAGGNNSIQLKSSGSTSGIVTTASGGTVSSVTVTWNSNTASGRTLDIYGKNTAYSSAADLYTSDKGTKLGSIVNGTSTSLDITGSYTYIGLRSNSNAMYLDEIEICWSNEEEETYTVSYAAGGGSGTVPTSHTEISSGSSITLKSPDNLTAPAGKQFAGWNDGSTTRAAGASYTVTDDVTMTAVWECITPTISSQTIANANYTVGQSPVTALSVTATGGTLSYQWQSSSSENGTYSNVSGATSSSFTPPVTAASDLWYRCVVKNTGSSCNTTTNSNKAHIVVSTPTPTITVSTTSLTGVGYSTVDFSQQVKSFTVSGTNLTANVSVAPPSGFEICTTEGGTYQTSAISLNYGSGTLSATTIYMRLCSGKAAGNYSGNITCSSTGATNKTVALSGSVPFTVTWQANGSTYATTYVAYSVGGTALGTVPNLTPDLGDYCGQVFYGWYDGNSYEHATVAPSIVNASTTITTDKTYNAVFADYTTE